MQIDIDDLGSSLELAREGISAGVEKENEEQEYASNEPFDPEAISISTRIVALDTVLRRLKNKTIRLAPDFQRSFIWDATRRSRLIESMILRIPLPMFYVSEDQNGIWEVVDGLQRLTTIKDFILGPDGDGKGDLLTNLEFWGKTLNGKNFFTLESDIKATRVVNSIMETELSFTIINPDTPEMVKRNIFKRINTGGMRLSEQEIRHALYQGVSTDLLKDMVEDEYYKFVTGNTVKDDRMAGRELILRFLAFYLIGRDIYDGNIDNFLSETMMFLNRNISKDSYVQATGALLSFFRSGLRRSYELFGEHSFRNSTVNSGRKAPINKSLFEVWINILGELNETEFDSLKNNFNQFQYEYEKLLSDEDVVNSISRYGASKAGAFERYNIFKGLVTRCAIRS